jgi:predicted GTPase
MKKIVLLGNTGVGKSTLGNVLLDLEEDSTSAFATSGDAESCTSVCGIKDGFWRGRHRDRLIRVIDAPGHGDSGGRDYELRESIVDTLRAEDSIHAFLFLKSFENPRVDAQDKDLIKTCLGIFGQGFLNNTVVVLTRQVQ